MVATWGPCHAVVVVAVGFPVFAGVCADLLQANLSGASPDGTYVAARHPPDNARPVAVRLFQEFQAFGGNVTN